MNKFLDMIFPRFVTEDVAMMIDYRDKETGDTYYRPVCCVDDLQEGEVPHAIASCKTFNLFGLGLFPRFGEIRPFEKGCNKSG